MITCICLFCVKFKSRSFWLAVIVLLSLLLFWLVVWVFSYKWTAYVVYCLACSSRVGLSPHSGQSKDYEIGINFAGSQLRTQHLVVRAKTGWLGRHGHDPMVVEFTYLCNRCLLPLNLWSRIPLMVMYTRYNYMW